MIRSLAGLALVVAALAPHAASAEPKSVIFYGNSFTLGVGSTRSVPAVFEDVAIAAGQDAPFVRSAAVSGQSIGWHVDNNLAPIFTLIPPADDWDAIVMQEHSTKMTRAWGGSPSFPASVADSESDVVALYNTATTRSAGVVPVLYETWARGPGHPFYTGANPLFPGGPSEMQAEVRAGYDALQGALNDAIGSDTALIAPVGDAWENADFDSLHSGDNWHAQNRGTLLAALVLYGTVYGDTSTSDIDLSGVLASLGLDAADGTFLTAAADETLNPIPEPSTAALAVVALGVAAGRAGRRAG